MYPLWDGIGMMFGCWVGLSREGWVIDLEGSVDSVRDKNLVCRSRCIIRSGGEQW